MNEGRRHVLAAVLVAAAAALPVHDGRRRRWSGLRVRRHVLTTVAVAVLSLSVLGPLVQAQDTPSAQELADLRARAEAGDADAQTNLGFMYGNGDGVPQDHAEAIAWFRLAAEQGHAVAQFALGLLYSVGVGVSQDYAEAVAWVRLAAEQGLADAQFNLGGVYATGDFGVPKDAAEAVTWYRQAAEQGLAAAQFALGVMLRQRRRRAAGRRGSRPMVPLSRRAGPRLRAVQPRVQIRHR